MKPNARGLATIVALLLSAILVSAFPSAPAASAQPPSPTSVNDGASSDQHEFVAGQLLVRFRPLVSSQRANDMLASKGMSRIRSVKKLGLHVLRLPPGLSVEQAVEQFGKFAEVEFAEPNYIVRIAQISDPGMAAHQWAPQKMGAPQAWLQSEGDPSVVIAVVDTGVDYRHSELAPNLWSNAGETAGNGADDDGNGFVDDVHGWNFVGSNAQPLDDNNHGTHVAGIAAAAPNSNSDGLVGICPSCQFMPVKVLDANGAGTMDAVASGITYAVDNGARVINLSLGASIGTSALQSAVDYAWSQNVLVVAASGNNGTDSRLYPAAYPHAMAVASTNSSDYHSCFSNYGSGYVSVAAPGEDIYSTTPLSATGQDTYARYSGTSMATPHVSGLAGLLFSQSPGRTNAQVRSIIETTAVDLGSAGTDPHFGAGRVSAARALDGDTSATAPPSGMFSDDILATGYANSRKLARDGSGALHLAWHSQSGGQFRVLYSRSTDGQIWSEPQVVFTSGAPTYNPALAIDSSYLYMVFENKPGSYYQTFFTRKALSGGSWSTPVSVLGGQYDSVRPAFYRDPSNGNLHLVGSSDDNSGYLAYASSADGGQTWSSPAQIQVSPGTAQVTRYADLHVNGSRLYVAARTVEFTMGGLLPVYRLITLRSVDDGATWSDRAELANYTGIATGEHGAALAGLADRLYLAYEHNGSVYSRRSDDGVTWSAAETVGAGSWPSVTASDDGRAWVIWENGGGLSLRQYDGAYWNVAESVLTASSFSKAYYPNLKLGTSDGKVEWVATGCCGAPFSLLHGSRDQGTVPGDATVAFSAAQYSVSESGGSATITVKLEAASARPVTVAYATANGTARSSLDYTAKSGTLTFQPGETSKTFAVTIRTDTTDEPDETVVLSLSNPTNAVLGDPQTATLTIQDDDQPPSVTLSSGAVFVHENAVYAKLTVQLSVASSYTATVAYATADGTAKAGADYTTTTGTLTFTPGQLSKTINVPIANDTTNEPDETLSFVLSNPSQATLGATPSATITIYANDAIAFSSSYYYVHENAGSAVITVKMNAPDTQPVSVNYAASNGTALAGSDYVATSGTLTFAPGETSKTFSVPIIDDATSESNETIKLTLSNAPLGAPSTASITVYANDGVSFSASSYYAYENVGSAIITVKLSGPSSQVVSVSYGASNGTAVAGSDYAATSGTLTFNPGEMTKTFTVPVLEDTAAEPNETVTLTLSNPSQAGLGIPSTATLIIRANDTLMFSASTYSVKESTGYINVTVKLNSAATHPVTVGYATADGTALAGREYTATSGTLTFSPGQTIKTFKVTLIKDVGASASTSFTVRLANPTGGGLGSPITATITITDDA